MLCVVQASKVLVSFVRALEMSSRAKEVFRRHYQQILHMPQLSSVQDACKLLSFFALLLQHRLPVVYRSVVMLHVSCTVQLQANYVGLIVEFTPS